jgi:hypothetical protein
VISPLKTEFPVRANREDELIRVLNARLSEAVFPILKMALTPKTVVS